MAGGSGMKAAPGTTRREAQLALARQGREQAEKKTSTVGSESKKARTGSSRESSSTGGDQLVGADPEMAKTFSGTPNKSSGSQKVVGPETTKTSTTSIPAVPLQSVPLRDSTKSKDEGKGVHAEGSEGVTAMHSTLPSDFLLDGELDREKLFP